MTMATYDRRPRRIYLKIRRVLDSAVSAAILLILSPVLIVSAVLIKLTSSGGVLFAQERSGEGGKRIRVYKFRTMRGNRRSDPEEIIPLNHPEITRIGRFLRRTKIDELPQLLNVLQGDMAIIGPRPTLPEQVARYTEFQRQRLLLRPGCTGLAQVNGNAAIPWEERIQYDVYYVYHCSPWLDLKILFRTMCTIVMGEERYARPFHESEYAKKARP